jgi:hypothetical protein
VALGGNSVAVRCGGADHSMGVRGASSSSLLHTFDHSSGEHSVLSHVNKEAASNTDILSA